MKTQLSPRDWELLSAYLDGELQAGEHRRLETRLTLDDELRSALEDLRRTRQVLRRAPRLKAPRNFTLTPQMVGQTPIVRPTRQPYPAFQLVSVLASLLLVIVLAGDLLGYASPSTSPLLSAQAPQPADMLRMPESPPAEEVQVESEPFSIEALEAQRMTEAPPGAGQLGEAQEKLVYGTPIPSEADSSAAAPRAPALESPTSTITLRPLETTLADEPSFEPTSTPTEQASSVDHTLVPDTLEVESGPVISGWRLLEISLAIVALSSGLAAVLVRRRMR